MRKIAEVFMPKFLLQVTSTKRPQSDLSRMAVPRERLLFKNSLNNRRRA